jgi:hypothetical protein
MGRRALASRANEQREQRGVGLLLLFPLHSQA